MMHAKLYTVAAFCIVIFVCIKEFIEWMM